MPAQITITPKSESTSPAASSEKTLPNPQLVHLINYCAIGLAVGFVLPWANFLGVNISGFELQKAGDEQRLLWIIPICCALTIIFGLCKISQKIIGQLTGLLPFIVGAFWYYKIGKDMFQILSYGAYLSLICGAALFILPRNMK